MTQLMQVYRLSTAPTASLRWQRLLNDSQTRRRRLNSFLEVMLPGTDSFFPLQN